MRALGLQQRDGNCRCVARDRDVRRDGGFYLVEDLLFDDGVFDDAFDHEAAPREIRE